MAPLSDRLFEFNNAALFRIYRLFLTGVEVTQAIQHSGAAEHLTDAADRGADNSLRLATHELLFAAEGDGGRRSEVAVKFATTQSAAAPQKPPVRRPAARKRPASRRRR